MGNVDMMGNQILVRFHETQEVGLVGYCLSVWSETIYPL